MSQTPTVPDDSRRARSIRAALLSALVLPGLGQLTRGARWRAAGFISITLAILGVLFWRMVGEIVMRMPADPTTMTPADVFALAHVVRDDVYSATVGPAVALLGVWAVSIWDAYRGEP